MTPNLATRLQDVPGVASVMVDLGDTDAGGIKVRLEPGADVAEVMELVRALLVAYGGRGQGYLKPGLGRESNQPEESPLGVDVSVTSIKSGARVEVAGKNVRSFRVVSANPFAIAQGLSDAWCQVIGRIPVEVVNVSVGDTGRLTVVVSDGERESSGTADVAAGWADALGFAIGRALGVVDLARHGGGPTSGPGT